MAEKKKVFGDSQVFCRGRFISGPDARSCVASLLMICVPSIIWHIDVGSFFLERRTSGAALLVITLVLQGLSLGLLLATALSDPGIVPRQDSFVEQFDVHTKSFRMKQPPRYFDIVLRGHNFKLKYCTTCNIYRPPRCTHCSVCENCVERFDHHCPWIGNCVGKRNYWLFYVFVVFTGLLNALSLVTGIAKVAMVTVERRDSTMNGDGGRAFLWAMKAEPLTTAFVLYCVGVVWFTIGLSIYHTYLVATNQTTYEQVKGTYSDGNNPFDRGVVGNFKDVLCSPVRPRLFDARTGSLRWPIMSSRAGAAQTSLRDPKACT